MDNNFDKLITSLELIGELYKINVCMLNDSSAKNHLKKHIHSLNSKNAVTIQHLENLAAKHTHEIVYLTDSFMLNYMIFTIDNLPIILGPFRSLMLSSTDVRIILGRNKIKDLSVNDFFSYYNSFSVISKSNALNIAESLYSLLNIKKEHRISEISLFSSYDTPNSSFDIKRENDIKRLENRYYYEQKFISDIKNGNVRSAILSLHNMEADVQHLKRLGTTLENEKIGAAITRTTARLAAMQANLPIYLIDQISRNNTITTINAKNVDDILQAKETMIREFCTAIHNNKNKKYSALVQSILYYFDHNYYKDITLNELSHELELSKNHIIRKFKQETGITPIEYLRNVRLNHATILLSGTHLSIQEISESVGIPDSNYFIKIFKNAYGVTPLTYRKNFNR